jgi:hypothetical protein
MKRDFNIHEWQAKYLREDSNKQQTAVEWLQSQISYKENGVDLFEEFFSKAKQIEKKQIIDAYKAAEDECEYFIEEHKWNRHYETAEPYYNNKYK